MERQILYIKGTENQNTVAKILFENGYTTRLVTRTQKNKNTKIKAIEYWRDEEK